MISRGFIKNSVLYTVAGAMPMASAIILLPFYVKSLSAADFGALSVLLTFTILIQIVVTYSFDASIYLYFHEFRKDKEKLARFISTAFLFVLLVGVVVSVILAWIGDILFGGFAGNQQLNFFPFGMMSATTAVFQSVFKMHNSLMQTQERPLQYLTSNLVAFVLIAGLTIGGLSWFPSSLMGPVGGRMVAMGVVSIWSLFRIFSEFGVHFDWRLLKSTFSYGHSSYAYQLQQWIINYFDRPIMAWMGVMADLGVYDFALKCLVVIDLVIAGLYNTLFPRILSRHGDQAVSGSTVEINRYYNGLTAAIMLLVASSILVLPYLIDWFVTNTSFRAVVPFIPFAALIFLLKGLRYFVGMPYSTQKYAKPLPWILAGVTITKLILSWILIRRIGIMGAVGATIVCQAMEIVLLAWWIRRRFTFRFNALKLVVAPLLLMLLIAGAEPFTTPQLSGWVHLGYVFFTLVLLLLVYRNEWSQIDWRKLLSNPKT